MSSGRMVGLYWAPASVPTWKKSSDITRLRLPERLVLQLDWPSTYRLGTARTCQPRGWPNTWKIMIWDGQMRKFHQSSRCSSISSWNQLPWILWNLLVATIRRWLLADFGRPATTRKQTWWLSFGIPVTSAPLGGAVGVINLYITIRITNNNNYPHQLGYSPCSHDYIPNHLWNCTLKIP
jgi:hypothetical protein